MPKILWTGDGVVQTGFGRVAHEVIPRLLTDGLEVVQLASNYRGERHSYPWWIYQAASEYDGVGYRKLIATVEYEKPDAIVICSDPWVVSRFMALDPPAPIIAYCFLDGMHLNSCYADLLNRCASIGWPTKHALGEAELSGIKTRQWVAPCGVDRKVFFPEPKEKAKAKMGLSGKFVFGNVNRNVPRKRIDLTMRFFADFIDRTKADDAVLYLHCGADDAGWELWDLAKYFGISQYVAVPATPDGKAVLHDQYVKPEFMRTVYSALDVQLNTGTGEGFGLPHLEGMACGTAQIAPNWAALGEWMQGGGVLVPCSDTIVHAGGPNVVGGLPDQKQFVFAMIDLYQTPENLKKMRTAAIARASEDWFDWSHLARAIRNELLDAIEACNRSSAV